MRPVAASRSGIRHILQAERNKNDLEKIPSKIKEALHFYLVNKMEEVLGIDLSFFSASHAEQKLRGPLRFVSALPGTLKYGSMLIPAHYTLDRQGRISFTGAQHHFT
jgi:hypothetical protein